MRRTGTSCAGSSWCSATKGITPRCAPAIAAVAGPKTAMVTARPASAVVAWWPRTAVSTKAPAEAAIIDR
ncbi:hypothetical protein ACTPOK_01805 [Streptomyces inhibens]|uniref:hypothetical protein n=1 Tax=Streptomyces inhibens TaxID=2293571 RepID=UPI00402A877A